MITIWQVKLLFALLLALIAALVVVKYNEAIEDVVEMRVLLEKERAANVEQANEIRALLAYNGVLNATLVEKQSYEDAIRTQLGSVHRKLNTLMADDPVAQEWGASPLPDSVRGILQNDTNGSGAGNVRTDTRGSATADTDSKSSPTGGKKQ